MSFSLLMYQLRNNFITRLLKYVKQNLLYTRGEEKQCCQAKQNYIHNCYQLQILEVDTRATDYLSPSRDSRRAASSSCRNSKTQRQKQTVIAQFKTWEVFVMHAKAHYTYHQGIEFSFLVYGAYDGWVIQKFLSQEQNLVLYKNLRERSLQNTRYPKVYPCNSNITPNQY